MRTRRWTCVLVIVGYALGAAALAWGLLPDVPPSWAPAGRGPLWLGAPMVAFLLPTTMAVTDLLLRGLAVRSPTGETNGADLLAIYDAIMLRVCAFVIGVHAMVLMAMLQLLGGRAWAARIVPLMLGVALISIGNLLPRTRPNLAIGIRTRRTLADRALWARIHRSVGYIAVACGAAVLVSALAVPGRAGSMMIPIAGPIALVGTRLRARSLVRDGHA